MAITIKKTYKHGIKESSFKRYTVKENKMVRGIFKTKAAAQKEARSLKKKKKRIVS